MRIAIIGAGSVGATLGQAWLKHGEDVIWGLRNPADPKYAFKEFYERVRDKGFILYPGKLTQLETFRVGCIGAIGPDEMRHAVNAVRDTLREMGIRQVAPAAVAAAVKAA